MAPKRTASSQKAAAVATEPGHLPPSSPAGPTAAAAIPGTMTSQPKAGPITMTPKGASSGAQNWDQVLGNLYNHYVKNTPQRTKLIDAFMAFLVVVGGLQFLYCVIAGNFVRLLSFFLSFFPLCGSVECVVFFSEWRLWKEFDCCTEYGEFGTRTIADNDVEQPFNAFLSGFSATVGQFVLTASLRIQTTEANKSDFPSVSPERAFADYVACSLILHFFCVNFIN
ncbi:DAD family-domain-containing protein [Colletotrichum cereale]|nr:DAD family-domain-containing protein [Colletotrichum cereale]